MSKKYPDYDKRYLITLNVYNHPIKFYNKKGTGLKTVKDYAEFINDNADLITEIYNYKDKLIKLGGGIKKNDLDTLLFDILDIKTSGKLDFYNESITSFKKYLNK